MAARYTTEDLINIQKKIDYSFMHQSWRTHAKYAFGINNTQLCIYYKLWLATRIISTWNQLENGDSTDMYNSITEEQFLNVVTDALNYCK